MVEQMEVTDWPLRLFLVGIMVAVIALVFVLMWRRWQVMKSGRPLGMSDLPAPASGPPTDFHGMQHVPGLFLGTSPSELIVGQDRLSESDLWMKRVMVHGLGVRSRANVSWDQSGIFFDRVGGQSFFIPRTAILAAGIGRGIAGTVRAKESVIMIDWTLGQHSLRSGFRADSSDDHAVLISELVSGGLFHNNRKVT